MPKFLVRGGKPLKGKVRISGSKNATLPILAATLLTDEPCVIKDVPAIEDTHAMLEILKALGSETDFCGNTVKIRTRKIRQGAVPHELGCKMRASVLLLGPLLAREGFARLPYPGGCVLGARPIDTHANVFKQMGVLKMPSKKTEIIFKNYPRAGDIVMPEFSVTGTENAIMAACASGKTTNIYLAALEPHVQDLCNFLVAMGVKIKGIGTHNLSISGSKKLKGANYKIAPDYLEAGTFILAAILTRSSVIVENVARRDLDAFWNLLGEMGMAFKFNGASVQIKPLKTWRACRRLQTNVFPGFPTDLQPPFAILLTQAKGKSFVHETLFEGRFNYFPELVKMGAKIEKLNPHEAIITGPTPLRATKVKSWDIRAGAAMILAALVAKGETLVSDIQYIDRGYEKFDEKLRALGADIERIL